MKLGLVPFGDIRPMDDELPHADVQHHRPPPEPPGAHARGRRTCPRGCARCEVGDIHTVPVSHGEGRFVAQPRDCAAPAGERTGQIATQYVDEAGQPTMDLDVNPNGSVVAIEGITSPDGRVLGKMGHAERRGDGLYKNVPGNKFMPLFESGVKYFTD